MLHMLLLLFPSYKGTNTKKKNTLRMTMLPLLLLVMLGVVLEPVLGHGRMMEPAQRSSLWRFQKYKSFGVKPNYSDNQLFCGGFQTQWKKNGGKCGVCGDAYNAPEPRDNEAKGKYGKGVIAETYTQGELINVLIDVTANHYGHFVFKLCPHNDVNTKVSQDCLDRHVLKTVDPNTGDLKYKYDIGSFKGDRWLQLQLPDDVTCTQCVLQWTYLTANSWACDENNNCCTGCGPQENFVNCADIAIKASGNHPTDKQPQPTTATTTTATTTTPEATTEPNPDTTFANQPATAEEEVKTTTTTPTPTTSTTTTSTTTSTTTTAARTVPNDQGMKCVGAGRYKHSSRMASWCKINCARGYCPSSHCDCTAEGNPPEKQPQCEAVGRYRYMPGMKEWCEANCAAGYCPPSYCDCTADGKAPKRKPQCSAVGVFRYSPGIKRWCQTNCSSGYCPSSHCKCT